MRGGRPPNHKYRCADCGTLLLPWEGPEPTIQTMTFCDADCYTGWRNRGGKKRRG